MTTIHRTCLVLVLAGVCLGSASAVGIGQLSPIYHSEGWGYLRVDRSIEGKPLQIGKRTFLHGLGTHARSEIVYELHGQYDRFVAWVGVDAEVRSYTQASVVFRVFADDDEVFSSGVMRADTPAKRVNVPIAGASELRLVAEDAGDGNFADHADWGDPILIGVPRDVPPAEVKYKVGNSGITLQLSERGDICGVVLGKARYRLTGRSRLLRCGDAGKVSARGLPNGGMEFGRSLACRSGSCRFTERFIPVGDSIRWEMDILGTGSPWSTPVITQLRWPDSRNARFWTAWNSPASPEDDWHDPLVDRPFADRHIWIGAPPPLTGPYRAEGDTASIPIASVLEPSCDIGVSLILSPEDNYFETSLTVSKDGSISFARANHRISSARPVTFAADIVPHKGDWRSALGWMVRRYPHYFNPPNPKADGMVGCGAYSSYEGDPDTDKWRKMAFRVNWKASFDFPYIGMFLPPVKSDDERWPRFDATSQGDLTGEHTETSISQMNAYSRRMRDAGFHVLNYLNVTEMGAQPAPSAHLRPGEPWADPQKFIANNMADAVLIDHMGNQVGSWGGALVMDPGVKSYQDFLVEQAERHITKLPASSGICIDRLDWLRVYNYRTDDGVSWQDGKPVGAISQSWKVISRRLGDLMHSHGKVVFANTLLARLDAMRELDGIYHEYGYIGSCLNATAFLCVRKPAMAWTRQGSLGSDPDAYFQRHLHMGVFPTAPIPGNDHTILPSADVDKWYLDYGPLLDPMRGKKWVLDPHVIKVKANVAKANLFEVTGGFALPVTFGGKADSAELTILKPSSLARWPEHVVIRVFHPGKESPVAITAHVKGDVLQLRVPLERGCAMVVIDR